MEKIKFRRKPIEISAAQFEGGEKEAIEFAKLFPKQNHAFGIIVFNYHGLSKEFQGISLFHDLENTTWIEEGDWIVEYPGGYRELWENGDFEANFERSE